MHVARPRLLDDEMAGRLVPQDHLLPVEIQLPVRGRTVSQVQIDETLIRNANIFRNGSLGNSQEHGQATLNLHEGVCVNASKGLPYLIALDRHSLVYHHL